MTPLLRDYGSNEVHLDSLKLDQGYLQTSPEYAMKCLLAETGQSIYQLCSAFRAGEVGSRHRVEFQMLEWYRVDYSLSELVRDLETLISEIVYTLAKDFTVSAVDRHFMSASYAALFREHYDMCPHASSDDQLKALACDFAHLDASSRRADVLDALFAEAVEPQLTKATIVTDFPACQAALAETRIDEEGNEVAHRFEFYLGGMEIANAYQELTDADELRRRFEENNKLRREMGKEEVTNDAELLSAMTTLPGCAGIALGVDRLLMALLGETDITLT